MEELDRELTDVFPEARDLLYYFLDSPPVLTRDQLLGVFNDAQLDPDAYEKVLNFLLYYGVLGILVGDQEFFIYTVNYNLKVLKVRAAQGKDGARYTLNPAFWPIFDINEGAVSALVPVVS